MAQMNGDTLRARRAAKRITQDALAKALGWMQQTVSDLETGRNSDRALLSLALLKVREMPELPRVKRTRRAA